MCPVQGFPWDNIGFFRDFDVAKGALKRSACAAMADRGIYFGIRANLSPRDCRKGSVEQGDGKRDGNVRI